MPVRPSVLPSISRCQLHRPGKIREGSPWVSWKDRGLCRQSMHGTAKSLQKIAPGSTLRVSAMQIPRGARFAHIREICRQVTEDLRMSIRHPRRDVESAVSIDRRKFRALLFIILLIDTRRIFQYFVFASYQHLGSIIVRLLRAK